MKYRKKPVVIEATQWFKNGDHPLDYAARHELSDGSLMSPLSQREAGLEGGVVRFYARPGVPNAQLCDHCHNRMHDHGWIDTLEGGHIVCPGDWIITGVKGEYYSCKPDIFKKTHELVEGQK